MTHSKTAQTGFTLIELLLYIAIVGSLLVSITFFFGLTAEARIKNQSVTEVNDQATAVMDAMTQTVRNATSITSPTAGVSASSLTLAVPTGALSPTIFDTNTLMGYNTAATTIDNFTSNSFDGTKFTANVTGTVSSINVLTAAIIGTAPNNKGQAAIYSDVSGTPGTLLGFGNTDTVLTANSWISLPISSTPVTSGTTYWLMFNANGTTGTQDNIMIDPGGTNQTCWHTGSSPYGTWPGSWPGNTGCSNQQFSMYSTITPTVGGGSIRIKEGAGAVTPLINSKVQVTNLTFKNLTRTGTGGIVQISFTLSRINPSNRNEYDYQKTFTTSAEVAW